MTGKERRSRFSSVHPALWVFLGVFLFQSLLVLHLSESRHFIPDSDDMRFYRDWARKISGEMAWRAGEANAPGTAFYGMPGYAYALAGIYGLTGGYDSATSPLLVALLQAAFHAGTATFLFLLCRRIFGGEEPWQQKRGAWLGSIAAVLWAALTPAQVFSAIHMPTAWVICAFWGLLYWIICLAQRKTVSWWKPWLPMGLLLGVVSLLVASVLMLLPLILLAVVLTVGRQKQGRFPRIAGAVAFLFAGFYAGCAPSWVYNYFYANDRVLFSAHDGLNFYLGNHSTANGYTKIPTGLRATQEGLLTDSLTIPEAELGRPLKRSEVSQYWKNKAQAWISANRLAWMRLLEVKADNFWNAFQYDDLSILRLFRNEGLVPPGLRWGFLAPLALAGLLSLGRWARLRWVAASVLLLMLALMPVFITERYRLIAAPGLILLGLGGAAWAWEKLMIKAILPPILWAAAAAGAAWWTTQPRPDIGLWSLDFYKAGIRSTDTANLLGAGQPEALPHLLRAQNALELAYAYVPGNTEVLFALGNVWMARRDPGRAEACYQATLKLDPRHTGVLANLGQIYSDRGQWEEAYRYLGPARDLEPENPKRWFALSLACKALGKTDEARETAERALALLVSAAQRDPKNARSWYSLAQVLLELERFAEAREAIQRALVLMPDNAELQKLAEELREK